VGDVLVVILIYCLLRAFLHWSILTVAFIVLVFAFSVEFLQLLDIVKRIGLEESKIARIVIGSSFSWFDLLAYFIGIALILIIEKR